MPIVMSMNFPHTTLDHFAGRMWARTPAKRISARRAHPADPIVSTRPAHVRDSRKAT